MRFFIISLALLFSAASVSSQIPLRGVGKRPGSTPPPPGNSPISNHEHPRLGFCLSSYSGKCQTRTDIRTRINASALLQEQLEENLNWFDNNIAIYVWHITSCTAASPSICTVDTDITSIINDGSFINIAGTSGYTPNLNNRQTGYYVDELSAHTFALYRDVALGTPVTVTVTGNGGFASAYAGAYQILQDWAFTAGFWAQMLDNNPTPPTGITPAFTAAQYASYAIGGTMLWQATSDSYLPAETYFNLGSMVYTFDWSFAWATPQQRQDQAEYMQRADLTDHWTTAPAWNNGSIPMRGFVLAVAAAIDGDGIDNTWATSISAQFAAKVCCDLTSYVRSWSEHGTDSSTSIIEGTNYLTYTNPSRLVMPEAYRTAHAFDKATFYTASTYATDAYFPLFMLHQTTPYGYSPSPAMPDNINRGAIRSHYAYTWRDGSVMTEIVRVMPSINAGILGFLDPDMAGLSMWYQRNRTDKIAADDAGQIDDGHNWIYRTIYGNESIASITPSSILPNVAHLGNNIHSFREHITDDNGYAVTLHTTQYKTSTAAGREAIRMTGHFNIDRKGTQAIIRGWNSHIGGDVSSFNRVCFPRIDRVRRDSAPASMTDDLGCIRANEGPPTVLSANDFGLTGALYLNSLRTSDENVANGRLVSYVNADITPAYPTSTTGTTINPEVTDSAKIDFLVIRGVNFGDPVRVIRRDFGSLTNAGVYQRVLTVNLGAEPFYNEVSSTPGPARKNGTNAATNHCRTTMVSATQITATDTIGGGSTYVENGKTRVNILWPTSKTVIKAGGPNESGKMWWNGGTGGTTTSCESVDISGLRLAVNDSIYKLGGGATSGNVCGSEGGEGGACSGIHNIDYTAWGAAATGFYYTEIVDTTGVADGNFYLTYEVGDSTFTPRTVASLTGLTNVIGHVDTSGSDRYIVVTSASDNISLTSASWTAAVTTSTAYTMVVTGMNPSSSRTLSCTNTTSFTQKDPVDASSPFTFDSAGVAVFTFTAAGPSVVCTIS